MSKLTGRSRSSIGKPFWIGFVAGPILFLGLISPIIRDTFTFEVFGLIALIFFCPIGGAVFQLVYDLVIATRSGLLGVWEYGTFAAVGLALAVAGLGLYNSPSGPDNLRPFDNKTFDCGVGAVALILSIYGLRRGGIRATQSFTQATSATSESLPAIVRVFAAGGFTLISFEGFVQGLVGFILGVRADKPQWWGLVACIVLGGVGTLVGFGILIGNQRAISWGRGLLLMAVAGGILGLLTPGLWASSPLDAEYIANMVASVALLTLLNWKRWPRIRF